jgi:hypothetical protein
VCIKTFPCLLGQPQQELYGDEVYLVLRDGGIDSLLLRPGGFAALRVSIVNQQAE